MKRIYIFHNNKPIRKQNCHKSKDKKLIITFKKIGTIRLFTITFLSRKKKLFTPIIAEKFLFFTKEALYKEKDIQILSANNFQIHLKPAAIGKIEISLNEQEEKNSNRYQRRKFLVLGLTEINDRKQIAFLSYNRRSNSYVATFPSNFKVKSMDFAFIHPLQSIENVHFYTTGSYVLLGTAKNGTLKWNKPKKVIGIFFNDFMLLGNEGKNGVLWYTSAKNESKKYYFELNGSSIDLYFTATQIQIDNSTNLRKFSIYICIFLKKFIILYK